MPFKSFATRAAPGAGVEGRRGGAQPADFKVLAVERTTDRQFLGMCGVHVLDWYPDDLEVGYRLISLVDKARAGDLLDRKSVV